MAASVPFVRPLSRQTPRTLGDKLQEIAVRSPADLAAFDTLADLVLRELDDEEARRPA